MRVDAGGNADWRHERIVTEWLPDDLSVEHELHREARRLLVLRGSDRCDSSQHNAGLRGRGVSEAELGSLAISTTLVIRFLALPRSAVSRRSRTGCDSCRVIGREFQHCRLQRRQSSGGRFNGTRRAWDRFPTCLAWAAGASRGMTGRQTCPAYVGQVSNLQGFRCGRRASGA